MPTITHLLSAGNFDSALELCRSEAKANPQNIELLALQAKILFSANQYPAAIHTLLKNLEKEGNTGLLSGLLIEAWSNEEKFFDILELYEGLSIKENLSKSATLCVGFAYQSLSNFESAIKIFKYLASIEPSNFETKIFLGNAFRYIGDYEQAIEVFYECIDTNSNMKALAWFSLSNLKSFHFSNTETDSIKRQIEDKKISNNERIFLAFALGKAFEDQQNFELSYKYYSIGNQLKNKTSKYDAKLHLQFATAITNFFEKYKTNYHSKKIYRVRPIFILGMPRSGSTLVEQILSSHSKVERMGELPYIGQLIFELRKTKYGEYPELLSDLTKDEIMECRDKYIQRSCVHRGNDTPLFVDKTPGNFEHIGFIKKIFPEALIIDTRREIRANAFSIFKQLFFRGQDYAYSIENIQAYYSTYVYFMNRWHAIYSKQLFTIKYEKLVDDFVDSVSELLAYCGLEDEQGCYKYFENKQIVETASSEQVRKPIYRSAKFAWRNYGCHFENIVVQKYD